jgi:hypothetical protein
MVGLVEFRRKRHLPKLHNRIIHFTYLIMQQMTPIQIGLAVTAGTFFAIGAYFKVNATLSDSKSEANKKQMHLSN